MVLGVITLILSTITNLVESTGYFGIFIGMTIESSFFPFPSEAVLIPAGYLISQGKLSFPIVFIASLIGSLLGAFVNYFLALFLGRNAVDFLIHKYGKFIFLKNEQLNRTDLFFKRNGEITTFVGRLIPVVRQLISLPAGFAKMNLKKFAFFTALGSGIWTLILILIGYLFGSNQSLIQSNLSLITYITLVFVAVIIFVYIYKRRKKRRDNSI